MLASLIGGFIVILVGLALLPTVADQVKAAQTGNVTGAASTVVGLTTLFYALGVMSAGIAITAQGLRAAGLLNA